MSVHVSLHVYIGKTVCPMLVCKDRDVVHICKNIRYIYLREEGVNER